MYKEIPRFTPEAFSYLHNPNTAKFKQFRQGLDQLLQEGVIQALYLRNSSVKTPLLAAVGPLQFEVVQFRLESEYGAASRLEAAPWTVVRWLPTDMKEDDLDALRSDRLAGCLRCGEESRGAVPQRMVRGILCKNQRAGSVVGVARADRERINCRH